MEMTDTPSACPAAEQFDVRNRWTGNIQFTATISSGLPWRAKIGAALKWAIGVGSDLSGAVLRGSVLRGSVLRRIRADLFDVLVTARAEAPGFLAALREGLVDGSVYEGECACLVGTLANIRGVSYTRLPHDSSRPIERFFTAIKKGDTPETNSVANLVAEWTELFIGENVA
jgi:hypothetical protein